MKSGKGERSNNNIFKKAIGEKDQVMGVVFWQRGRGNLRTHKNGGEERMVVGGRCFHLAPSESARQKNCAEKQ